MARDLLLKGTRVPEREAAGEGGPWAASGRAAAWLLPALCYTTEGVREWGAGRSGGSWWAGARRGAGLASSRRRPPPSGARKWRLARQEAARGWGAVAAGREGGNCSRCPPVASPQPCEVGLGPGREFDGRGRRAGRPGRWQGLRRAWASASPAAAGVSRVRALEVQAEGRVRAFVGEAVVLRCWFRSSSPLTEKLTIDWTYRALAGGALEPIFHYQSRAYPAREGTFRDRVSWAGDVAKRDASIVISDPRMEDNGTFTCSVKNPPDVHHSLPQVVLTVTQRGSSSQLSSAGLLSLLVFLPSAVVVAALLVRMGKKSGVLNSRKKFAYKMSSIEVVDEPEQPGCAARLAGRCVQCLDTDDEDPY
ncbi:myelin protein zero-like protein 3 [Sphaerodactylus townsendi]|uniref:myelin protein zero-like protein 3 n=1 Tax=Sphaerodactylus townsendi TaxID=933632 RepID=UPI002026FF51|nr:myelin protein zero-like protein 3 [Sphaerodactylus townsendi]